MEILFENHYTQDKAWAKEIYRYLHLTRPLMVFFHIVFALYFLYGLYTCFVGDLVLWQLLLIPLAFGGISLFGYYSNVKMTLKRNAETFGKPLECQTLVTDQQIIHKASNGAEGVLHYCDIKKVLQTKNYIFILSKAKLVYSFKKDAFTVGSADGFLYFLQQKNIKVKR